ncbi:MAG: glycosyltransferase family 4 protein [Actinomycetota bacterium]
MTTSETSGVRHLLVTNDFPPKIGGIQSYLWELWRRLEPEGVAVYTTPYADTAAFDAAAPFPIERSPEPVIGPYPWLVDRINRAAAAHRAQLVVLDPAVPLGAIGPQLELPYAVVLHGAEVTIPGRLPGSRALLRRTLLGARLVIAAGGYPAAEAERCAGRPLPTVIVPPGVDHQRFMPLTSEERLAARTEFGLEPDALVVASVNRLVGRKGIDVLIHAAAELARDPVIGARLRVLIGGRGRLEGALARQIEATGAPVTLLGRVSDAAVARLYGAADLMAMLCHDRWFGLEQEGFGIVFLEAAATGIPQVAGRSGGAHEAVEHDVTGVVLDEPRSVPAVVEVVRALLSDDEQRVVMGSAARARAVQDFDYDLLARRLQGALTAAVHGTTT